MQLNVLAKKRRLMYPRSIQLIMDVLHPNIPRPVYLEEVNEEGDAVELSKPHHVRLVRQFAFKAMVDPMGRSVYKHQVEEPGVKFGQFAETEPDSDEMEVEEEGDNDNDDDHDGHADDEGGDDEEEQDEHVDEPETTKAEQETYVEVGHQSKKKHDKGKEKPRGTFEEAYCC